MKTLAALSVVLSLVWHAAVPWEAYSVVALAAIVLVLRTRDRGPWETLADRDRRRTQR